MNRIKAIILCISVLLLTTGCGGDKKAEWLKDADLSAEETSDELYEKALKEDTLVIYSISTRITEVKQSFERQYPGLAVEVIDVRSDSIVNMVESDNNSGKSGSDIVICNDNSGELSEKLIDTGFIYPYIPYDIAPKLRAGHGGRELLFLDEAQLLYYNSEVYNENPITNIWELCEEQYRGKIYMPSPLRSYSTYGFCAMTMSKSEELRKAYSDYSGTELEIPDGKTAAEVFWEKLSVNVCFTNSSDETAEALGSATGKAHFGLMISSKQRLKGVGYHFEPIYKLNPFSGSYASTSVMITAGSKNISSAKLFIRWLLGEADGSGEGALPYKTEGTWSVRNDVSDGNAMPLSEIDLLWLDKDYMKKNKDCIAEFFTNIVKQNLDWSNDIEKE